MNKYVRFGANGNIEFIVSIGIRQILSNINARRFLCSINNHCWELLRLIAASAKNSMDNRVKFEYHESRRIRYCE
jgi:hypothetical protein